MKTTQDRRYKLLSVSQDQVILTIAGLNHKYLSIPDNPTLPDDATVIDVHYDISTRAFSALLHSPEWDEVEPGCEIPRIDESFGFHVVEFRQGTDGKWGVAEENPLTPELTCGDCQIMYEGGNPCGTVGHGVTKEVTACVKILQAEPQP